MADPSVAEAFTRLVDLMARLRAPGSSSAKGASGGVYAQVTA